MDHSESEEKLVGVSKRLIFFDIALGWLGTLLDLDENGIFKTSIPKAEVVVR